MDIELARTFLAIVETGSFLEAANKVYVTQSTVSMRIRSLEQQLGRSVFERGKSGATLTPAGHRFHKHAQALVRCWTQARIDASLPDAVEAALEIGAVPSLWDGFLIDAMPEFMQAFPNVAVHGSTVSTETLLSQTTAGALDLAVMYDPRNTVGLTAMQLFEDDFVLVSSDFDTSRSPFEENYVLIDWGPEFRADHLLNFPEIPTPMLQLGIGTLGLNYLKAQPGAGFFPWRVVAREVETGWLRVIEDAPRFAYAAYAVFADDDPESLPCKAAQLLSAFAKKQFPVTA